MTGVDAFQVAFFGALAGILGDKDKEHERVFAYTLARLRASRDVTKKICEKFNVPIDKAGIPC